MPSLALSQAVASIYTAERLPENHHHIHHTHVALGVRICIWNKNQVPSLAVRDLWSAQPEWECLRESYSLHKGDEDISTTHQSVSKSSSICNEFNNPNDYLGIIPPSSSPRAWPRSRFPHRYTRPRLRNLSRPLYLPRSLPQMDPQHLLPHNGPQTKQAYGPDGPNCPCCRPGLFHVD